MRSVSIYHNILWAKYKGIVFSQVFAKSREREIAVSFVQVAETEGLRSVLSKVDLSYHKYPFRLLFHGAYEQVSKLRLMGALAKDLIRNPSDMVVLPGYDRPEYWLMLLVCIVLRRTRAVFCDSTEHDRQKFAWKELAKRTFFKRCDGFLCYGARSKAYILHYGVEEWRIFHRCQAAALPHDYDPEQIRRHYQSNAIDTVAPHFIYVGRLSVEKGLEDLLAAFRALKIRVPGATLDLVGAGPLRDHLEERVKEFDLTESIAFRGSMELEQIAPQLLRSVALVLPSHSEPWGLVVNEALSYGCPVVVSNVCGCVPELVSNDVTGYHFEAHNVEALTDALFKVIALSADRPAAAALCMQRISNFTPQRSASDILESCNRIMDLPA